MENIEDILKEFEKINTTSKKIKNTDYHVSIVEDQFGKEELLISAKKENGENYFIGIFVLFFSVLILLFWITNLSSEKEDLFEELTWVFYLGFPFFGIVTFFFGFSQLQNTSWTISKEKISSRTKPISILGETKILISNIQSIEVANTGWKVNDELVYGIYCLSKDKTKNLLFTSTNKLATDKLSQIIRKFLDSSAPEKTP